MEPLYKPMTTYYKIRGQEVARYQYSVVDVAVKLNSSVTGTRDPLRPEIALLYREFLLARLADWEPTVNHELCFAYDEAVRQLCWAAVAMYEKRGYVDGLKPADIEVLVAAVNAWYSQPGEP